MSVLPRWPNRVSARPVRLEDVILMEVRLGYDVMGRSFGTVAGVSRAGVRT